MWNKIDYKHVSIYKSKNNTLYIIPSGISKKYGILDINKVYELSYPYNNEDLYKRIIDSLKQCSYKKPKKSEKSVLELYLGISGYQKAIKDKVLLALQWDMKSGYYLTPTKKERGFKYLEDKNILLGEKINNPDYLAQMIEKGFEMSE